MPTGKVKWFDPVTGEVRITGRSGHEYVARAADLEPAARAPRARVTFDIERDRDVQRAVRVRLHEGTRTSPLQRRFGDMAGARRPNDAGGEGSSREHPDRGGRRAPRLPAAVAREWIEAVAEGDLAAALRTYAPNAVVHGRDGDRAGRRAVQRFLEGSVLLGTRHADVQVSEEGTMVHIRWRPSPADLARTPPEERRNWARLRVEHGQIVEQWA